MLSEFRHYWIYLKVPLSLSIRKAWSNKAYSGGTTEATFILNRKVLWTGLVNFGFRQLYLGTLWVTRLGGPQSWSGHFGDERNLLPLPRRKPRSFQPSSRHYTKGDPKITIIFYGGERGGTSVCSRLVRVRDCPPHQLAKRRPWGKVDRVRVIFRWQT